MSDEGAHVDPVQLYGSSHTLITGNYFHGNSTGIMAPNGGDTETVTNNVIVMDGYPYAAYFGWARGLTVAHNTIVGGSIHLEDWTDGTDHPDAHTSGVVRDNVLLDGLDRIGLDPDAVAQDYNLLPSGDVGAHGIEGRPAFAGGSDPSSYAGFRLTGGSPGKGAASDGTDMGIDVLAGPSTTSRPGVPGTGDAPGEVAGPGSSGARGTRSADVAPRLRLLEPKAGRLGRDLSLEAIASDDVGIARVDLWIDARRVASRARGPYRARRRVAARLRRGNHTVSARAIDSAGQVATVAAALAGGRVLPGRVSSVPLPSGSTQLRATGLGKHALVVQVAHCGGGPARSVRLSGKRTRVRLSARGLCVVSLARR